ncbi:MAG: hypothetical protein HPY55_16330 [Firmicutes bacterium]|nr:hypothetical protein [Bacillota bacterium]
MTVFCASGPAYMFQRGGQGNRAIRKAAMAGAQLRDPKAMRRLERVLRVIAAANARKGGEVA